MAELDSILESAREKPIDRDQALFLLYNTAVSYTHLTLPTNSRV